MVGEMAVLMAAHTPDAILVLDTGHRSLMLADLLMHTRAQQWLSFNAMQGTTCELLRAFVSRSDWHTVANARLHWNHTTICCTDHPLDCGNDPRT